MMVFSIGENQVAKDCLDKFIAQAAATLIVEASSMTIREKLQQLGITLPELSIMTRIPLDRLEAINRADTIVGVEELDTIIKTLGVDEEDMRFGFLANMTKISNNPSLLTKTA
ncbi:MAG: hypothetical protein SFX19_01575 [Alphaproteobacteria bacterium]|nr:hypothetical protein [Alphaproteobacteria bacterium]